MGRILVVDDSYAELQLIQAALNGLGHDLVTAMDGEEGERIAKAGNINLIILDVILPKKNGFQVCRELKKDDKYKHIPIIMVTSKDQDSDQFWGLKQGANEYMKKPFNPSDLVKLGEEIYINNLIGRIE